MSAQPQSATAEASKAGAGTTAGADANAPDLKIPDLVDLSRTMADIGEHSQRIVSDFLSRHRDDEAFRMGDPLNIGGAFLEMTQKMITQPARLVEAQLTLWQDYLTLWQNTTQRMLGAETDPMIAPARNDRRFRDAAWEDNQLFDFIKQSYLLTARWMHNTVNNVEGLDDRTAKKVDFYTRQFVDAMAPSNFLMTNPEVIRTTLESGGENLVNGLNNLLEDLERGHGKLRIRMTDLDAFEIGRNIATTPGKVVYQNDLMQLIQYTPKTEQVRKVPLLIIPPWINKYYILDLREKNSFIRWLVGEGFTVFVISWVNPSSDLAEKSFDNYMMEGPHAALDAIEKATGERQTNAIGYCLGGTLLAATLAYMAKTGDDRFLSATYLTTMTDFSNAGELAVFIDEEQLRALEHRMSETGYLDGSAMATTFNMLRANDLIWSFVVNNYLLGKDPFPFDLLYWNSDSTRMPAAMHSFYLRSCYQDNKLVEPGGLTMMGTPIDLREIETPSYLLSTREDHIAPWTATYAATQLYKAPVTFTLAASGHIAGVVNPPAANKYCYWTNESCPPDCDSWLASATQHEGSWWPAWAAWVKVYAGEPVPAREPGGGGLPVIEDAPGSYVKVRTTD